MKVNVFKHVPGVNDAEYIKLLEQALERQKAITSKAIAKCKEMPKEELLDDGTLVVWTNIDMTKFSRVNVRQIGTHYGDLFYPDEEK